jgi:hypothetical protein
MHACDNPSCCNPTHLRGGTNADNTADKMAKGRHRLNPRFGAQHPFARFTDEQVIEMRRLAREGVKQKDIAARFGSNQKTVSFVVTGKGWRHLNDVAPPVVQRLHAKPDASSGQYLRAQNSDRAA